MFIYILNFFSVYLYVFPSLFIFHLFTIYIHSLNFLYIYLSLSISIFYLFSILIYLCIYTSFSIYIHIYPSIFHFQSKNIFFFTYLSLNLLNYPFFNILSIPNYLSLSVYILSPSIYLSFYLSLINFSTILPLLNVFSYLPIHLSISFQIF